MCTIPQMANRITTSNVYRSGLNGKWKQKWHEPFNDKSLFLCVCVLPLLHVDLFCFNEGWYKSVLSIRTRVMRSKKKGWMSIRNTLYGTYMYITTFATHSIDELIPLIISHYYNLICKTHCTWSNLGKARENVFHCCIRLVLLWLLAVNKNIGIQMNWEKKAQSFHENTWND